MRPRLIPVGVSRLGRLTDGTSASYGDIRKNDIGLQRGITGGVSVWAVRMRVDSKRRQVVRINFKY